MYDQDSYALYCAMILQENQEQGSALDPEFASICESYLTSNHTNEVRHENA